MKFAIVTLLLIVATFAYGKRCSTCGSPPSPPTAEPYPPPPNPPPVGPVGPGIEHAILDATFALLNKPCLANSDCLIICKNQAINPLAIIGAACLPFGGSPTKNCCCYTATTNACCRYGCSGLDCIPRLAPQNIKSMV